MLRTAPILLTSALLCVAAGRSQQTTATPELRAPDDLSAARAAVPPRVAELLLPVGEGYRLLTALAQKQYPDAERVLLAAITGDPHSLATAARLRYLGGVYMLAHDPFQAAVAWNKAAALAPLPSDIRFSLALAYVELGKPDWARKQLNSLAAVEPDNAEIPYWLGRLDYDAHQYPDAIGHFDRALQLDPSMSRAYDNRGLSHFYLDQNDEAIADFRKSIALDRNTVHPSPWPYMNLGVALEFLGQRAEAASMLQQAIALDPSFAQAHYELGNVLVSDGKLTEATAEYERAAKSDPSYAEPHAALARMYRRTGDKARSDAEVALYKSLRDRAAAPQTAPAGP